MPVPKPGAVTAPQPLRVVFLCWQHAGVTFIATSGCVSCHNNSLTSLTMVSARRAGIAMNGQVEENQLHTIAGYLDANRERALEGFGIPGGPDTVSYIMLGLSFGKEISSR